MRERTQKRFLYEVVGTIGIPAQRNSERTQTRNGGEDIVAK